MRGAHILLLVTLLALLVGSTNLRHGGFPSTLDPFLPSSIYVKYTISRFAVAAFFGNSAAPLMVATILFLATAFFVRLMARE